MLNSHAQKRALLVRPLVYACRIAALVMAAPWPARAHGLFEALIGCAAVEYAPPQIYAPPGCVTPGPLGRFLRVAGGKEDERGTGPSRQGCSHALLDAGSHR